MIRRSSPNVTIRAIACVFAASLSQAAAAQDRPGPGPRSNRVPASVRSKDGTAIAYERSGKGPALILVGPALASRADARGFASLLAPSFTVINFDRRGRGQSGLSKTYAVEREIEDIDALVELAGGSAFLFGSSSGAALALEAANKLGTRIEALVAFEPPFIVDGSRPPIPADFAARLGSCSRTAAVAMPWRRSCRSVSACQRRCWA